jgi:hypothetical protein
MIAGIREKAIPMTIIGMAIFGKYVNKVPIILKKYKIPAIKEDCSEDEVKNETTSAGKAT